MNLFVTFERLINLFCIVVCLSNLYFVMSIFIILTVHSDVHSNFIKGPFEYNAVFMWIFIMHCKEPSSRCHYKYSTGFPFLINPTVQNQFVLNNCKRQEATSHFYSMFISSLNSL